MILRPLAVLLPLALAFPASAQTRYPGYGTVQSITPVKPAPKKPLSDPYRRDSDKASASAGASAESPFPQRPTYRITIRMDDGRTQTREVAKPEVRRGQRVLLTNAGDVVSAQ